jgi:hypothetical protein
MRACKLVAEDVGEFFDPKTLTAPTIMSMLRLALGDLQRNRAA